MRKPWQNEHTHDFTTTYYVATNTGASPHAPEWLDAVISHPWFTDAIHQVALKRRRHASRIALKDLKDTLASHFVEHASCDPWLGREPIGETSLTERIWKWLDSRARHLFPRTFHSQTHRPRDKGLIRHIEASSVEGAFERASKSPEPADILIEQEIAGELTRLLQP